MKHMSQCARLIIFLLTYLLFTQTAPIQMNSFSVSATVGTWYEVHANRAAVSLQKNVTCIKFEVGSSSANNLLLTVDKTSSPSPTQIHGTLGIASNGKLTYSLNAPKKRTNGIGYLLASGPTVSGKYSYVIVADMDKKKVVVLARDVQTFRSKYVNEVKKKLKELGYNDGVKLLSYCGL